MNFLEFAFVEVFHVDTVSGRSRISHRVGATHLAGAPTYCSVILSENCKNFWTKGASLALLRSAIDSCRLLTDFVRDFRISEA